MEGTRGEKMYLPKEDQSKIVDFLKKEFNPKFIYIFGSFAKGEGRNDSDIDLAIYTDEIIDGIEKDGRIYG